MIHFQSLYLRSDSQKPTQTLKQKELKPRVLSSQPLLKVKLLYTQLFHDRYILFCTFIPPGWELLESIVAGYVLLTSQSLNAKA